MDISKLLSDISLMIILMFDPHDSSLSICSRSFANIDHKTLVIRSVVPLPISVLLSYHKEQHKAISATSKMRIRYPNRQLIPGW